MKEFIKKEDETRKDYLVRIAIYMLEKEGGAIENVIFDEAECDAFCLADDLRNEFNVD